MTVLNPLIFNSCLNSKFEKTFFFSVRVKYITTKSSAYDHSVFFNAKHSKANIRIKMINLSEVFSNLIS